MRFTIRSTTKNFHVCYGRPMQLPSGGYREVSTPICTTIDKHWATRIRDSLNAEEDVRNQTREELRG